MSNLRIVVVLAVATAAAVAGAVFVQDDSGTIAGSGEAFLAGFLDDTERTAKIEITAGEDAFSVAIANGRWVVPGKGGYPAAADKVHQLVVGAAELRRLEPKTSNPELYSRIGLAEEGGDRPPIHVAFRDSDGAELARFILGKERPARGDPELEEYYVRTPDDPQTWLVGGNLPGARNLMDFLDRRMLEVERARVREVRVRHGDGELVRVSKDEARDVDFSLADLAEGAEVEQYRLNDIGRGLTNLEFDDVAPVSERPQGGGTPGYVVEMETFDGLRVTMTTEHDGEQVHARLVAAYEEGLAGAPPAQGASEAESAEAESALRTPDQVRTEADTLNARWGEWIYRLRTFKAEYFAKRGADLLKAPQAPAPGAKPAG